MFDGIFLDLYGTLTAGDRHAVESVCADIVADAGLDMSAYDLSITWGGQFFSALDHCSGDGFCTLFDVEVRTLRETMAALGKTVDAEKYAHKLRDYWRNPPLQPEVRAFLAACRVPICIVSNADRDDAVVALAMHEIEVAHIVTSEDARSYKPDGAIFDHAFRVTGWKKDRVIHVGDSLHSDVGGAHTVGIKSGWLNRAHRIHDIGTHTPHHEFEDLHGLLALLGHKQEAVRG